MSKKAVTCTTGSTFTLQPMLPGTYTRGGATVKATSELKSTLDREISAKRAEVQGLEAEIKTLEEQYKALEKEIREKNSAVVCLRGDLTTLESWAKQIV